jgi:Tfp pilus assembly protein PilZ
MRKVDVKLGSRQDLLRSYLTEAPHGGLMVSTKEPLNPGEVVELHIEIGAPVETHLLRGAVLWCRADGPLHTAGVAFLASEVERREQLLRYQGTPGSNPAERRERRYATTLKVVYQVATDLEVDYTRNISAGGVFIDNPNPPAVGVHILFRLFPPGGAAPIDMAGKVAWRLKGQGFGVRFSRQDDAGAKELERLCKEISCGASQPVEALVFEEVRR